MTLTRRRLDTVNVYRRRITHFQFQCLSFRKRLASVIHACTLLNGRFHFKWQKKPFEWKTNAKVASRVRAHKVMANEVKIHFAVHWLRNEREMDFSAFFSFGFSLTSNWNGGAMCCDTKWSQPIAYYDLVKSNKSKQSTGFVVVLIGRMPAVESGVWIEFYQRNASDLRHLLCHSSRSRRSNVRECQRWNAICVLCNAPRHYVRNWSSPNWTNS